MSRFKKATKQSARLRAIFTGVSGSGKTFTALRVGCAIAKLVGGRVAVIDSERGSASKYSKRFDFDVLELETHEPQTYVQAIRDAEKEGYAVIVIDSLSHAWMGKGGALEQVDAAAKRSKSGNTFTAWRDVTPVHQQMIDAIVGSSAHVIATARSKTEYALIQGNSGQQQPKKLGLAPVQRDGLEFEFDVVGDIDIDHNMVISKTRCEDIVDAVIAKPGEDFAEKLVAWLTDGEPTPDVSVLDDAIEAATDEPTLDALIPDLQKLRGIELEERRQKWGKRRAVIRAAQTRALSEAAKKGITA